MAKRMLQGAVKRLLNRVIDDVLFVLLQRANGLEENVAFWKRRYPDRSAWYFGYFDGGPMLVPLERLVHGAAPGALVTPAGSRAVSR